MTEGGASGTRRDTDAYVYLALMVLIGSTTATAAKFALREVPFGLLPIVRFGGAGLCLLPLAWRGGAMWRMLRESPGRLLGCAALCVPINQAFFLNGTRLAPTTHVGLIYASCPLVVLGLAVALRQERLVPSRLAGVAACVIGVLVVGLDNLWHATSESVSQFRGDLLLVGAVVSWGGYLTLSKPLINRHGALVGLAGTFLVGTLLHLPIAVATMPGWPALSSISASAWWSLVYMTLIVTVLGLASQNLALRRLDASQVAAVGNAGPFLTILWGVWLLGESFKPALVLGGILTAVGIVWTSWPVRARPPAELVNGTSSGLSGPRTGTAPTPVALDR